MKTVLFTLLFLYALLFGQTKAIFEPSGEIKLTTTKAVHGNLSKPGNCYHRVNIHYSGLNRSRSKVR